MNISTLKDNILLRTVLISVVALVAVVLITQAFVKRNSEQDIINVTGMGTIDIASDLIVWTGNYTKTAMTLKEAYAQLSLDNAKVTKYLENKQIPSGEIQYSSIVINKEYENIVDKNDFRTQVFKGFRLEQKLKIESKDITKVEAVARGITELINAGVEFYSDPPQYYYSQLPDLKMKLIEKATANGRERAELIATQSRQQLGSLKNANLGVFQIIQQNSNEDYSWSGSYNTDSKLKTATITVKLQYGIK